MVRLLENERSRRPGGLLCGRPPRTMTGFGHSRRCRVAGKPGHVRYAARSGSKFRVLAASRRSAARAAMMVLPAGAPEPVRLQLDAGDAGRDVQPGLALHADRLQRVGIRRPADQKVAAETDADRGVGADAAITAGEFAASESPRGRVYRPGKPGLVGEAEIDAVTADGCDVGFGTAAFALVYAFEAGHRADHEADILTAPALQHARAHRRQCIGARDRRHQRSNGNCDCRNPHNLISAREVKADGQKESALFKTRRFQKSAAKRSGVGTAK